MDTTVLDHPKAQQKTYGSTKPLATAFTQLDGTSFFLADFSGNAPRGEKIERELTYEEEKIAFLYTSKINTAKMLAKYIE
jgi:hypothetical protein